MRSRLALSGLLLVLACALGASAQAPPRLVRFSGVVRSAQGQPRTGMVMLTFGLHAEAEGGTPLWTEPQTVTPDAEGRYAVMLGATRPEGLPLELFTSAEARWLGVRVEQGGEPPRVLLVSVPYALKAADAATVEGKPLSAFVLTGDKTGTGADGLTYVNVAALVAPTQASPLQDPAPGGAVPGTPIWQHLAEWFESVETLEPGTVVVVDPTVHNGVRPSMSAYDPGVAGAVLAQPGPSLGERSSSRSLVAQSGRVRIKVDASYGAIKAGDLLVTSPTPGHAMVSRPMKLKGADLHRPGTILGKALEPLASGKGEILVLLTLQ